MSVEDRVWREGDPKWTWAEDEIVPRYMWSQFHKHEVCEKLNETEQLRERVAELENQLETTLMAASLNHAGLELCMKQRDEANERVAELEAKQPICSQARLEKAMKRVAELEQYAVHKQWPIHAGLDYGEQCQSLMPTLNPSEKRSPCDCGLDELLEQSK